MNSQRDGFLDPKQFLIEQGIKQGQTVADLGSGNGHFSLAAARLVGPQGLVYAVDIRKVVLAALKNQAERSGLSNLQFIWSDLEQVGAAEAVKDETVDFLILVNIFYLVPNRYALWQEAIRMARPGAIFVVSDWEMHSTSFGPKVSERVELQAVKKMALELGLHYLDQFKPSASHWGLRLQG